MIKLRILSKFALLANDFIMKVQVLQKIAGN